MMYPARSKCSLLLAALLLFAGAAPGQTNQSRSMILVIGASGEPEYAEQFSNCAALWKTAAATGGFKISVIGEDRDKPDEDLRRLMQAVTNEVSQNAGELWLIFIGHGTYDGKTAKFNLRGPDISATNLAAALKPCRRPLAVIQCASASAPFMTALSAPGRVIITATRSGYELNATRFGNYLARAIADPEADLDKDGQVSLLEAFLAAARRTQDFYKEQGRMLTEHALIDDNGDGLGTPADWFHGVRATKAAANGKSVDGIRAHQLFLAPGDVEKRLSPEIRARRDELEQSLSALRLKKSQLKDDDYYQQLEVILVEMAKLYDGK